MSPVLIILAGVLGLLVVGLVILPLLVGGRGNRLCSRDLSGILVGILVVLVGLTFLGAIWLVVTR